MLEREEYVEQAYLFRILTERLPENVPLQEILLQLRQELLATTKLPMALDYLLAELKHSGCMSPAMEKLKHYFAPFQTYVITEAESDKGRFDMRVAVDILRHEAEYRAAERGPQGLFMYQFECLCRNRLRYDPGLTAMAADPAYDPAWREWILYVRQEIGIIELADLIYLRSEEYQRRRELRGREEPLAQPLLFGVREGRIAFANRQKDPLYLFAAMQRQLNYPTVPRQQKIDEEAGIIPQMQRRMERLEARIKLLEEEQQQGSIDITKFYGGTTPPDFPKVDEE